MSVPAMQGSALDAAAFFDAALARAAAEGVRSLKSEFLSLLAREASLIAMGDSSLRIERAQDLLHSLRFSMGLFLKRCGMGDAVKLLQTEAFRTLLQRSRDHLKSCIKEARAVYDRLVSLPFTTKNRAYNDTVFLTLPAFFSRYDALQAAHDIPCSIDYPISSPIENLEGIEYIGAYLNILYAETRFLSCFEANAAAQLLSSFYPEPDEQLISLFEPVFFNAMGRCMLQEGPLPLDMPPAMQGQIFYRLEALDFPSRANAVRQAAQRLIEALGLAADEKTAGYLLNFAQEKFLIGLELFMAHGAPRVFTTFILKTRPAVSIRLRSAPPMPDDALRALINELPSCRFLSDKLSMLSREVHSLEDWLDVVPLCFSEEEYDAVFSLLGIEELAAVARRIEKERSDFEAPPEWQIAFLRYLSALHGKRAASFHALMNAAWRE
ncbi:MAG TPA: DUF6179 domain-containing protein [Clostridia bacterium]|nr:DUF6179 domain-containing protein [Clostridia bacterium]